MDDKKRKRRGPYGQNKVKIDRLDDVDVETSVNLFDVELDAYSENVSSLCETVSKQSFIISDHRQLYNEGNGGRGRAPIPAGLLG